VSTVLALLISLASVAGASSDVCKQTDIVGCPDAFMPKPRAYSGSTDGIMSEIRIAQQAKKDEELKRGAWEAAGNEVERIIRDKKSSTETKAADLAAKAALYKDAAATLKQARKATADAYNSVISRVIMTYHLTPPVTDFSNDPSLPINLRSGPAMSMWSPHFSEDEIRDNTTGKMRLRTGEEIQQEIATQLQRQRANGLPENAAPHGAVTDLKHGNIMIFASTFEGQDAPLQLAALIAHETTHWVDAIQVAGKVRTPYQQFELESRGYAAQARFLDLQGRANEAAAIRETSEQYEKQAQTAARKNLTFAAIRVDPTYQNWLTVSGMNSNSEGRPVAARSKFPGADDAGASDIDAAVAKELAHARTEIEKQKAVQTEANRRDAAALTDHLRDLANWFCLPQPDGADEQDPEQPPRPHDPAAFAMKGSEELQGSTCFKAVYSEMSDELATVGRVDFDRIRALRRGLAARASAFVLPEQPVVAPTAVLPEQPVEAPTATLPERLDAPGGAPPTPAPQPNPNERRGSARAAQPCTRDVHAPGIGTVPHPCQ